MPALSTKNILDGSYFEKLEKYMLDQFVLRDAFRSIKAYAAYYIFQKSDNNGIYIADDFINKIVYPLNEKSVKYAADKFNELAQRYFNGKNLYYSVIPDKSHYLKTDHPKIDFDKMCGILSQNIKGMTYIDISCILTLGDYYKTDIHWRQERLPAVAKHLLEVMGSDFSSEYAENKLYPFYGGYWGQSAINLAPETLVYLTNDIINSAQVYFNDLKLSGKIYYPEKFNGMDPYDVYLDGAKPLITLTNTKATNDRELIVFRDSFGSSLAPLLISGYSKITLIDLRYISSNVLEQYVDIENVDDVLFIYNSQILNNNYMLK